MLISAHRNDNKLRLWDVRVTNKHIMDVPTGEIDNHKFYLCKSGSHYFRGKCKYHKNS